MAWRTKSPSSGITTFCSLKKWSPSWKKSWHLRSKSSTSRPYSSASVNCCTVAMFQPIRRKTRKSRMGNHSLRTSTHSICRHLFQVAKKESSWWLPKTMTLSRSLKVSRSSSKTASRLKTISVRTKNSSRSNSRSLARRLTTKTKTMASFHSLPSLMIVGKMKVNSWQSKGHFLIKLARFCSAV